MVKTKKITKIYKTYYEPRVARVTTSIVALGYTRLSDFGDSCLC